MNPILKRAGTVILTLFAIGAVGAIFNNNQVPALTSQSKETTARNSFISGCTQNWKYPSVNANTYCNCAYDKLSALYPDFATNSDRFNRIITQGYNSTETDAVTTCISAGS